MLRRRGRPWRGWRASIAVHEAPSASICPIPALRPMFSGRPRWLPAALAFEIRWACRRRSSQSLRATAASMSSIMLLMAANMLWVNSSEADAPTQDGCRAAELHEADRGLGAQGKPLRAIADAVRARATASGSAVRRGGVLRAAYQGRAFCLTMACSAF